MSEIEEMSEEYSKLRSEIRGMKTSEKAEFLSEYIQGDFKNDIASFTNIAIKIYTYLGPNYFMDSIDNVIKTIHELNKLDKYPF
jgi:hypothetical protein